MFQAVKAVIIVGLILGFSHPADGQTTTVSNDRGGVVIEYALKKLRLQRDGTLVRFAGACDSACTLFLGLPPDQLCVAPGASFGFHLPYGVGARAAKVAAGYLLDSYPVWVRAWLRARGGLTGAIKRMSYTDARQHMQDCSCRSSVPSIVRTTC